MWLIAGLGNPDTKYQFTRHNAGFLVVDQLADIASSDSAAVSEASWKQAPHCKGLICQGEFRFKSRSGQRNSQTGAQVGRQAGAGRQKALFVKPLTYMNRSGDAVGALMRFYKVDTKNLIVVHDDLDMDFGKVKAKFGGGHGGNNGVRDIIGKLGTPDFHRIKVGIGRPKQQADLRENSGADGTGSVSKWVLSPFSKQELEGFSSLMDDVQVRLGNILVSGGS